MGLVAQLTGAQEPKLPVHQFWASLVELSLGELTAAQIKSYFELDAQAQSDFDWLIGKYNASANKPRYLELMHALFMLAEIGTPGYVETTDLVARINRIG